MIHNTMIHERKNGVDFGGERDSDYCRLFALETRIMFDGASASPGADYIWLDPPIIPDPNADDDTRDYEEGPDRSDIDIRVGFSTYEEQGDGVFMEDILISNEEGKDAAGNYHNGYIIFTLDDATEGDRLELPDSEGGISYEYGVVSVEDGTLYIGTGAGYKELGAIDDVHDGQTLPSYDSDDDYDYYALPEGAREDGSTVAPEGTLSLRINFFDFDDRDFTGGMIDDTFAYTDNREWPGMFGWYAFEMPSTPMREKILGYVTPYDDDSVWYATNFGGEYSITYIDDKTRGYLRLRSEDVHLLSDTMGGTLSHGPFLVSDEVTLNKGEIVQFDWKAKMSGDMYDVYAYILEVNTGYTQEILHDRSDPPSPLDQSASTDWVEVQTVIGRDGDYRVVFIAGSVDSTNGGMAGGTLYIDNLSVGPLFNDEVVADIASLVRFRSDADYPEEERNLTISMAYDDLYVDDEDNRHDPRDDEYRVVEAATVTTTITITPINDAPIVALKSTGEQSTSVILKPEDASKEPQLIFGQDADVVDVSDPDNTNFDGGYLLVSHESEAESGDRLWINDQGTDEGQIGVDGNTITYGGVEIGEIDGTEDGADGAGLKITFNEQATPDAVRALIENLTYENPNLSSDSVTSRTIGIRLNDGGDTYPEDDDDGSSSSALTDGGDNGISYVLEDVEDDADGVSALTDGDDETSVAFIVTINIGESDETEGPEEPDETDETWSGAPGDDTQGDTPSMDTPLETASTLLTISDVTILNPWTSSGWSDPVLVTSADSFTSGGSGAPPIIVSDNVFMVTGSTMAVRGGESSTLDAVACNGGALAVNRGMENLSIRAGEWFDIQMPYDVFSHVDPEAEVQFRAMRVDGSDLPGWLRFDPRTATFTGMAPGGLLGEVFSVKVVVRDLSSGCEVGTTLDFCVVGDQVECQPKPMEVEMEEWDDGHSASTDRDAGRSAFSAQLSAVGQPGFEARQTAFVAMIGAHGMN